MSHPRVFGWKHGKFTEPSGEQIFIYEITFRCADGQFLFAPDDEKLAPLLGGCIGRAAEEASARIFGFHVLSNHGGIVAGFKSEADQVRFRQLAFGWMGKETNVRRNRTGGCLGSRSKPIQIDGEAALVDRLKYCLGNGCAENLIRRPEAWPGAHSAKWQVQAADYPGVWVDRTGLDRAKRKRGNAAKPEDFTAPAPVKFAKLPHLAHLSDADYAQFIKGLCDEIAAERKARHGDKAPLGEKILCRPGTWRRRTLLYNRRGCAPNPKLRNGFRRNAPNKKVQARSCPRVHTACPDRRKQFYEAYYDHVANLMELNKQIVVAAAEACVTDGQLAANHIKTLQVLAAQAS